MHTLRRGVHIRIAVSDFDPIGAAELHRGCWSTRRKLVAASEVAGAGRLEVVSALHSSDAGFGARIVLCPGAYGRLRGVIATLNAMDHDRRARFLTEAPGLAEITRRRGKRLAMRAHLPRLYPATHHQKIAVFDRTRLYIGGLDLNERRYDMPDHRQSADRTWHDVQAFVEGPVVDAAQRHLDTFLGTVAGHGPPVPPAPGFLRTLSRRARLAPFRFSPVPTVTEIERAHLDYTERARNLVYLETQFFRHVPLAKALARRAGESPGLRLILLACSARGCRIRKQQRA